MEPRDNLLRAPLSFAGAGRLSLASEWALVPTSDIAEFRPDDRVGFSLAIPSNADEIAGSWLEDFVSRDSNMLASAVSLSGQAYYDQLKWVSESFEQRAVEIGRLYLQNKKALRPDVIKQIDGARSELAKQLLGLRSVIGRRYWDALPRSDFEKIWQIRNAARSQVKAGSKAFEGLAGALPAGVSLPQHVKIISGRRASLLGKVTNAVIAVEMGSAAALLLSAKTDRERRAALGALTPMAIGFAADQAIKQAAKFVVARYGLIVAVPLIVGTAPGFVVGLAASVALGLAIDYTADAASKLIWRPEDAPGRLP